MKRPRLSIVLTLALAAFLADPVLPAGGGDNGRAGELPAYYDGNLLTINFKQISDDAALKLAEHNKSLNTIYMSDAGLPDNQPFVPALDAIQGDGFNPLWVEVQVSFTAGHTPHQLFSDTEILDAAAAGEVDLAPTGELYRCSVVGPK